MELSERITQTIQYAIDQLNELLPKKKRLKKAPQSVLFGHGSPLDSLGLVNLIIFIEQGVEEEFSVEISFGEKKNIERAIDANAFGTIESLANFIELLLTENAINDGELNM